MDVRENPGSPTWKVPRVAKCVRSTIDEEPCPVSNIRVVIESNLPYRKRSFSTIRPHGPHSYMSELSPLPPTRRSLRDTLGREPPVSNYKRPQSLEFELLCSADSSDQTIRTVVKINAPIEYITLSFTIQEPPSEYWMRSRSCLFCNQSRTEDQPWSDHLMDSVDCWIRSIHEQ